MKKLAVILLISGFTIAVGCSSVPPLRAVKPVDYGKRMHVAVSDIQNQSGNKDYDPLMGGLTGSLTAELHEVNCFHVIERQKLLSILEEIKLSMEGLTDPANARAVGTMAGADAILFMNLVSVKYSVETNSAFIAEDFREKLVTTMNARLVDVKSGRILAASKVSLPYTHRYGIALGFVKSGGKIDQKVIVQENLEYSIEYLTKEVAWQASNSGR